MHAINDARNSFDQLAHEVQWDRTFGASQRSRDRERAPEWWVVTVWILYALTCTFALYKALTS